MMTTRRTFTFASLAAAAAASTARASGVAQEAGPPALLGSRFAVERKPGELVVRLTVTNQSGGDLEIVTQRGSRPGAHVVATLATEEPIELAEILGERDRREMMSRMGPIPQFQSLVAGADVELGPWRFTLPKGADQEPVSLVAYVDTSEDRQVLHSGTIPAGKAGV